MPKADVKDLFDKPKNPTEFLIDIHRYKEAQMSKAEITAKWSGMQWCNPEMRAWAKWNWKEVVK